MDCVDAQSAISEALDKSPVDAALLEEAKSHCKMCPDCGAFVRALSAAKRAPLPEPAADLPDRIMTAIRAEALATQIAAKAAGDVAAEAAAHGAAGAAAGDAPIAEGETVSRRVRAIFAPRNRAQLVVWTSAAAVLVAVAGIAAINGVRMITGVTAPQTEVTVMSSAGGSSSPLVGAAPESAASASKTTTGPADTQRFRATADTAAKGVSYISISGAVYRLSGVAAIAKTALHQTGTASTALAATGEPTSRPVYSGADASRVYLEDGDGKLIAFDRVVRNFRGTTYQQQSSPITLFETWPALPAQISAPQTPDGSPELVLEGTDDTGVKVYRLASSGALTGIGIAPGTASTDPAAGNPNWTWWTPVR